MSTFTIYPNFTNIAESKYCMSFTNAGLDFLSLFMGLKLVLRSFQLLQSPSILNSNLDTKYNNINPEAFTVGCTIKRVF